MENTDDIMRFNDIETDLDIMANSHIMPELMNDVEEEDSGFIVVHMDLREKIANLRKLVENCTGMQLANYEFWLQDSQILEPHKNLVDQCVQGEGLVQINVQVQPENRRINIVDVLKPTEDVLSQLESDTASNSNMDTNDFTMLPATQPTTFDTPLAIATKADNELDSEIPVFQIRKASRPPSTATPETADLQPLPRKPVKQNEPLKVFKIVKAGNEASSKVVNDEPPAKKNVIRWFVDNNFKQTQIRLKIPDNPEEWNQSQVRHWLQWAIRQFNISGIKLDEWNFNGKELNTLTIQDFQKLVPNDPSDIFWTHLELLRKCKFVASIQKQPILEDYTVIERQPSIHKKAVKTTENVEEQGQIGSPIGNRTGNNGQVQLWQFLLEMLTSKEHREIIQWSSNEGEFKLLNAEMVAQLWGEKKHKTTMTYEKLSRALRYYYDGDMISKVNGKRFTYRFVCDLKELIGYNAQELARLVEESDRVFDENSLQLD